jgi:thiamine-monophosphate kinase
MSTLRDIGEDPLIDRLVALVPRPSAAEARPGDDCAAIDTGDDTLQLLKTDAIVSGVHFLPDAPARAVGWKAAARVTSDMAAMGGAPKYFLVTIAVSPETPVLWLEELYRGISDCLTTHQAVLVGGETCRIPSGSAAVISIAATGTVLRQHLTLRSGGKPGDILLVTGSLGGSITGKHLSFTPRIKESDWLVSNYKPSAMMDLSDGLAKDLPRLVLASRCGFALDTAALPCTPGCTIEQALNDGEDYELLLAVAPETVEEMRKAWAAVFPELPLTVIGQLTELGEGQSLSGGWDHFA